MKFRLSVVQVAFFITCVVTLVYTIPASLQSSLLLKIRSESHQTAGTSGTIVQHLRHVKKETKAKAKAKETEEKAITAAPTDNASATDAPKSDAKKEKKSQETIEKEESKEASKTAASVSASASTTEPTESANSDAAIAEKEPSSNKTLIKIDAGNDDDSTKTKPPIVDKTSEVDAKAADVVVPKKEDKTQPDAKDTVQKTAPLATSSKADDESKTDGTPNLPTADTSATDAPKSDAKKEKKPQETTEKDKSKEASKTAASASAPTTEPKEHANSKAAVAEEDLSKKEPASDKTVFKVDAKDDSTKTEPPIKDKKSKVDAKATDVVAPKKEDAGDDDDSTKTKPPIVDKTSEVDAKAADVVVPKKEDKTQPDAKDTVEKTAPLATSSKADDESKSSNADSESKTDVISKKDDKSNADKDKPAVKTKKAEDKKIAAATAADSEGADADEATNNPTDAASGSQAPKPDADGDGDTVSISSKKRSLKETKEPFMTTSLSATSSSRVLSLLYPMGLMGGFRNQAMRLIGLLKYAINEDYDSLLLPTLIWSTRFKESRFAWPVPFDELFDVDHWNSFHKPRSDGDGFAFPKLVSTVVDKNDGDVAKDPDDRKICWTPEFDRSIVSEAAIQALNSNYDKSVLPPLTHRMLFGDGDDKAVPARQKFILDPVQAKTVEYLTGDTMKNKFKIDMKPLVENCTHPHVFGGQAKVLWNSFLQIGKTFKSKKKKELARRYTKLMETVDEALVPAKPWRQLADHCVEHHLGLGDDEFAQEEDDPHAVGHDHGYIALHSRIEPEMLSHNCGKHMEQNLTTILDLVDLLSIDYNSEDGSSSTLPKGYESPIGDDLREEIKQHKKRPLKGTFVAVAREELEDGHIFKKFEDITRFNKEVLNKRSMSYDSDGGELYSTSLEAKEQKIAAAATGATKTVDVQDSRRRLSDKEGNGNKSLPIFECGEGWVEHAFYKSEARQKKLFTPKSPSELEKDYGLYHRYGPQTGILPLPEHYYGDLLPSMLNFWLAVRADVFVGTRGSSWSTDVWTTRYYMGKGNRNFEYTKDHKILAMGNGGLPPPHQNCAN